MNWVLLGAAALAGLTTGVHFFAGGKGCLGPMLAAEFDAVAKRTMHVCWHAVTLDLTVTTATFAMASLSPESGGWAGAAEKVPIRHRRQAVTVAAMSPTCCGARPLP